MKKPVPKPGFWFIFIALFCYSCKKDKNDPKSKTTLLTQQTWKIEAAGVDTDKNGTIDIYATLADCEKDNLLTFNSDGTVLADEGTLKCNSSDPQTKSVDWAFVNNETAITSAAMSNFANATGQIYLLNDNKLVVYEVQNSGPNGTVWGMIVLKH